MNLVGRMADALNEVASIVEESHDRKGLGSMMHVQVNDSGDKAVHVEDSFFLESFRPKYYDVLDRDNEEYPIKLVNETDGVKFYSIFTAADVVALKDTHPDHFNYIQKELQHE